MLTSVHNCVLLPLRSSKYIAMVTAVLFLLHEIVQLLWMDTMAMQHFRKAYMKDQRIPSEFKKKQYNEANENLSRKWSQQPVQP